MCKIATCRARDAILCGKIQVRCLITNLVLRMVQGLKAARKHGRQQWGESAAGI